MKKIIAFLFLLTITIFAEPFRLIEKTNDFDEGMGKFMGISISEDLVSATVTKNAIIIVDMEGVFLKEAIRTVAVIKGTQTKEELVIEEVGFQLDTALLFHINSIGEENFNRLIKIFRENTEVKMVAKDGNEKTLFKIDTTGFAKVENKITAIME